MRKLKQTFILKALEKELKEHDWTFQMSDDHGYYSNGISEQARIKTMVQDAYAEGCDPADLFYQYYPKDGCEPADHYGIRRSWEEQLDKKAQEMSQKVTVH
jgi:hypothetical protein